MSTTRESGGRSGDDRDWDEQENFARAVESGRPEISDRTLQRELTVVAALCHAGPTIGPDPAERDRMRQRVMAEFAAVVHDGSSPILPLRKSRKRRWLAGEAQGRLAVTAAAGLCLVMSLSGMSVLLSRDALPGDALYTFKRSAESAQLGLTFGDQPKALKHLEFASARVSEIETMADQADTAGSWSEGQGKLVQALDDFDADTIAGARLLTALASTGQIKSLPVLHGWAQQQESRLSTVRAALPLPTSTRLDRTLGLLDRVETRASALDHRSGCATITSGTRDDLGLLPAKDTCQPAPVDDTSSTTPLPGGLGTPEGIQPNMILPPGLLGPTSVNTIPVPGQADQTGRGGPTGIPGSTGPGSVLPAPGAPETQPQPPLSGDGSTPAPLPLQLPLPGAGLPSLTPPAQPHS